MPGWSFDSEAFTGLEDHLEERVKAMVNASGGRLWLVSGYRSRERQQQLWEQALAKYGNPEIADNWVANPNEGDGSNHQHGRAVDMGGTEEGMSWMRQNMHRFGLWQPMEWEPWHLEAVDTAVEIRPEAYTNPPLGQPRVEERTDVGMQFARMLGMLDRDTSLVEAPGTSLVDGPGGDLTVENPSGIELDTGAAMEDFGFAELPGAAAEATEQILEEPA